MQSLLRKFIAVSLRKKAPGIISLFDFPVCFPFHSYYERAKESVQETSTGERKTGRSRSVAFDFAVGRMHKLPFMKHQLDEIILGICKGLTCSPGVLANNHFKVGAFIDCCQYLHDSNLTISTLLHTLLWIQSTVSKEIK